MQRIGYTLLFATLIAAGASCGGAQETASNGPTTPDTASPQASGSPQNTAASRSDVSPIPEGFFTLTPALVVDDVDAAVAYYTDTLAAKLRFSTKGPDGSTMHAEVEFGDSVVMLSPAMEQMGSKSPKGLGGSPGALLYYVEDVDAAFAKAVAAGSKAIMPVGDQFWGDRYGMLVDPFGHRWGLATHKEDVPPEQMAKRVAKAMKAKNKPVKFEPGTPATSYRREGFHTLTPSIALKDAKAMIEFYKNALGATELERSLMPDGRVMHAMLQIGDSMLMVADEFPEHGTKAPVTLGGSPFSLMVYVPDVDTAYAGAVAAGAKAVMPVGDQFWGDRYGMVADPSGYQWGLATHKEDLTPEQIQQRMAEQMAKGGHDH